jgi:hypothetical protein
MLKLVLESVILKTKVKLNFYAKNLSLIQFYFSIFAKNKSKK